MFDSVLEPIDDEEDDDLPPALAPRRQGRVAADDRDTLLPPVPPAEYVKAMMALGELDDPLEAMGAPNRASMPKIPRPGKPLGLVLASEHEMMFEGAPPEEAPEQPGSSGPPTKPWADQGTTPRPLTPRPLASGLRGVVVPAPARRRSTGSFPAVDELRPHTPTPVMEPRLPVPRAPSIPPEPSPAGLDSLDSLDSLDGLGSLETLDGLGSLETLDGLGSLNALDSLRVQPLVSTERSAAPSSAPRSPIRLSATPSSAPSSSKPFRAPNPAGLRLPHKTPLAFAAVRPDDAEPAPVSEPAPLSLPDRVREMAGLFEARNYSSALVLAESVLASDPGHAQARRCAESCREMLGQKYLSRLGGRENIPRVSMSADDLRSVSLDHRAGFLLSFVDGAMSIDEVLDVSAMPELDALRIMFELRMQGVIEIVEPPRRRGRR
jgi:hypothetical protein